MNTRPARHQAAYSYRTDTCIAAFPDDKPIIIFDGECVLCSAFAQFVLRHDRLKRFRLLAAQTALGKALYQHYGLDALRYTTNILLMDGRAHFKSEASLKILRLLGLPWSLASVFRALPLSVRDKIYDYLAARRLRWFGTRTCFMPGSADADRFLG